MKRFILLLLLFANIARMSAQTFDIKGTVYDESKNLYPGALSILPNPGIR